MVCGKACGINGVEGGEGMTQTLALNTVHEGDCLELMRNISDGSVDMILCDLPYGTTRNKWDSIIPLDALWAQYERIIKDNGAIVLTAAQPFTSALIMSNTKLFKYEWIWEKTSASGHLNAKKQPLRNHESVTVFYGRQATYNPQGLMEGEYFNGRPAKAAYSGGNYGKERVVVEASRFSNYPKSVQKFSNSSNGSLHPTQKPVALFEYLIRTYTQPGEVVLDNCIGSGTTAVAAINTGRNFIGIEQDAGYVEIARHRIDEARTAS